MGWNSANDIFLATVQAIDRITNVSHSDEITSELLENIYTDIAENLRDHDWDTLDEVLDDLDATHPAHRAISKIIGYNPDCPGSCSEMHYPGSNEGCGCPCHMEE